MARLPQYDRRRWADLKARVLGQSVAISDEERRCVECEVRGLELWLKRYRAYQQERR